MKLISTLSVCKGFAMCRGHITSNDFYEYTQEDVSSDARFSQIFYLLEGSGTVYNSDGSLHDKSDVSNAWDIRYFYKKPYKFVAGDRGATWICINPIPADKFFDMELIKQSTSIEGTEEEQNIICVKGTAIINDKQLKQFNYARIPNGKVANITVPEGSELLYIKR